MFFLSFLRLGPLHPYDFSDRIARFAADRFRRFGGSGSLAGCRTSGFLLAFLRLGPLQRLQAAGQLHCLRWRERHALDVLVQLGSQGRHGVGNA